MKQLAIILLALLSGCTMYTVEKVMPDGSSTVVRIKSTRSFETPDLHYTRTGQDATFDFSAASVDNNTAAMMGIVGQMMSMMQQMMIKPVPVP